MPAFQVLLERNVTRVRATLATACATRGRAPAEVTLVAVTKYAELDWIRGLYDLGLRDFGESRPQQLVERARLFPTDVRWHLIGHLQRNKAALVVPHVHTIHSVDSVRLARQLSRDAESLGRSIRALLEVNVSGEAAKDGFGVDDLRTAFSELFGLPRLEITGLMTMAPLSDDAETSRPVFGRLRELRDELRGTHPTLVDLSMGMSGDYGVGVEEGATLIRVGTALWEGAGGV
jgi:hypothetical protein